MRKYAIGLAALGATAGLWGCVSTPPAMPVNHQRIVPLATTDVWTRVHHFLQDEGIAVESENTAAGIIDAGRASDLHGTLTGLADCGTELLHPMRRQNLRLTVLIKPQGDGAKVTVNAAFSETLASRRTGTLTVACPSTGVLEAAVLSVASGQPMEAAVIPR